ncbi:MAG: dehydrogenase, partial [Planctomycetota bacterium]
GVPFESRSAPHPDAREDADLVVHATGAPDGLALALSLAGNEATVVEASWYGDRPVPAPLGEAFHSKRLRLVSSQVGALPPHRVRRWDHGRRLLLALRLLREPALDALLTDEHPFDDIVSAMPRVL